MESNKISKKEWILIIGISILLLALESIICFGTYKLINNKINVTSSNLMINQVKINNQVVSLKKGDYVEVNYWNSPYKEYNETSVHSIKFYNDLAIDDSINDVIQKLELKSGYALINSEVATKEHDGTTDIINKEYINTNSFDFSYLDACIIIGYKYENNKWKLMSYSQLDSFFEDKKASNVIIYRVDINGMSDGNVDENHAISISVEYY